MRPNRLIIHRTAPFGRYLRRRFIRTGQRRRQTHPILQLRCHLLMRPQAPSLPCRALPLPALPIPTAGDLKRHFSHHRVQRQRSLLALLQGEKPRPPPRLVLAAVAAIVGASIPGLQPKLPLPLPLTSVLSSVHSLLLPRLMVVLGWIEEPLTPLSYCLITVSRCAQTGVPFPIESRAGI